MLLSCYFSIPSPIHINQATQFLGRDAFTRGILDGQGGAQAGWSEEVVFDKEPGPGGQPFEAALIKAIEDVALLAGNQVLGNGGNAQALHTPEEFVAHYAQVGGFDFHRRDGFLRLLFLSRYRGDDATGHILCHPMASGAKNHLKGAFTFQGMERQPVAHDRRHDGQQAVEPEHIILPE